VPPTADASLARTLHSALAALPVVIESVGCAPRDVPLASYPGGVRASSIVRLGEGRGEHVGWTPTAHEGFRARLDAVPRGRWRIAPWVAAMQVRFPDPYDRAALEAAAIDLALRQRGTDLAGLVGAAPEPVRYVVSFEKVADPVARAAEEAGVELKIDADPGWDDATWAGLGALGRVAVLDFKGAGTPAAHERAHAAVPGALIEDPGGAASWSESLRARISFDAVLTSARALDVLPVRPAAVNLKPARMAGVLEAVACAARCAEEGIAVYLGGMFEVGPGRKQLAALAALLCPEAPNDVAPLVDPLRPARLTVARTPGLA